jgi:hypothetical protein
VSRRWLGPILLSAIMLRALDAQAFGAPSHHGDQWYPNQPAGAARFAENDGSQVSARVEASESGSILGVWEAGDGRNLTIGTDPRAPKSSPSVIRTRYPTGLVSGRAPVSWKGWDVAGSEGGQKRLLYTSVWIKIGEHDYENEPVGTKLGFLGYGMRPGGADNSLYYVLVGSGRREATRSFRLRVVQQGSWSRNLAANRIRGPVLRAGTWHQVESVFILNHMGRDDGVLRVWVDGRLVLDYSNVRYITRDRPFGFYMWKWNPTWGGNTKQARTREDVISIDHVYLSGLPYEEAPTLSQGAPR